MKKNLFKVLTALALVFCTTFAIAGCGTMKVTAIDLAQSFKTQYEIGETLDISNGFLRVTYEDDTQKDLSVTESMVSGFHNETVGQKTMILSYKNATKNIPYTITGPSLKEDRYLWYNNTDSTTYTFGYYVHKENGVYTMIYLYTSKIDIATLWTNLQDPDYLEEVISGRVSMRINLNESDYYYYASLYDSPNPDPVQVLKIQSIDNFVDVETGVNELEGFTRYIPA